MKPFVLTILFFFCVILSYGQRVVVPLEFNPEQAEHYKNSRYRLAAVGDTLTIPFFDDFTQGTIAPDAAKWVQNGGTFINDNYPINPPNFNVATFDGLQQNGTPYTTNTSAIGLTDNLTSKPIDLSGLITGDSIYLRFYWQGKGNGEKPDPFDSIRLQLKNQGNNWNTVWKRTGDSTAFNHEIIRIGDAAQYYYNGFQFRYQSYGRMSGSYDVWNIDYVHLDTGRIAKDNWFQDYSFATHPSSFLKNYSAMPIQQYISDIPGETADSIRVILSNLTNKPRTYYINNSADNTLKDIYNNVFFENTLNQNNIFFQQLVNTGISSYWKNNDTLYYKPTQTIVPNTKIPRIIKYSFGFSDTSKVSDRKVGGTYQFTGTSDLVAARIDYTANDSIHGLTYITEYFAYDDSTAEFGYGVDQKLGKVAMKYNLNVPDSLTHIDIYFPRIGPDQSNEPINLMIWSSINLNTSGQALIYAEDAVVHHSSALNKFYRYKLATPQYLPAGPFYVGYQQSTNEIIYTGLDKNNDHHDKIFYNVDDTWFSENLEQGSLMIRPVFSDGQLLAVTPQMKKELECEVFPNPSTGTIQIIGKVSLMNVYDLSGKLLLTKEFDSHSQDKFEDLSALPNGFYIMHLENDDAKTVKKIVLNK